MKLKISNIEKSAKFRKENPPNTYFYNCRKWKVLQSVQDRNETLFYRMLMDNFLEMVRYFSYGTKLILYPRGSSRYKYGFFLIQRRVLIDLA